jgi:hypothetical protein
MITSDLSFISRWLIKYQIKGTETGTPKATLFQKLLFDYFAMWALLG